MGRSVGLGWGRGRVRQGAVAPAEEASVLRSVRPRDGDGGRHGVPEGHLALSPGFDHNALHLATNPPTNAGNRQHTRVSTNVHEIKQ